ncbi:MmcQ/YjbR family DNA-binding protein [Paenibacillus alginolyticus]|uniref:MmcQ/YjbR family DNA-binding protein n=1 Tax=Paenibacillus alginolyticus TaxID=59839 RepID=A0ABT4GL19_9BACL|nr:MmcQ/YjbR family DNA-binding protein [Paenibacillus alginolyticus]MCY9696744.1 MmcQ/YjbR family DNA-binding protein [Paenibacillus alginolyticus]MEC0147592.1 MmcQ/YjbR family DNA-binding protein [Paenibacillus alginolyticus]
MTHQFVSVKGLELVAKVRAFCMELPEAEEKVDGFGHITFRVKDKPFVMMGETDGQPSTAIKTNLTTQEFSFSKRIHPTTKRPISDSMAGYRF